MDEIKKEVGERLKQERIRLGLTQSFVAKKLNMTQQQYSRFENGVFELNYSQLLFLSNLFEVSIDYLFGKSKY